jgi:hypothetical protein
MNRACFFVCFCLFDLPYGEGCGRNQSD